MCRCWNNLMVSKIPKNSHPPQWSSATADCSIVFTITVRYIYLALPKNHGLFSYRNPNLLLPIRTHVKLNNRSFFSVKHGTLEVFNCLVALLPVVVKASATFPNLHLYHCIYRRIHSSILHLLRMQYALFQNRESSGTPWNSTDVIHIFKDLISMTAYEMMMIRNYSSALSPMKSSSWWKFSQERLNSIITRQQGNRSVRLNMLTHTYRRMNLLVRNYYIHAVQCLFFKTDKIPPWPPAHYRLIFQHSLSPAHEFQ